MWKGSASMLPFLMKYFKPTVFGIGSVCSFALCKLALYFCTLKILSLVLVTSAVRFESSMSVRAFVFFFGLTPIFRSQRCLEA